MREGFGIAAPADDGAEAFASSVSKRAYTQAMGQFLAWFADAPGSVQIDTCRPISTTASCGSLK
jgi:hypothetical protein